MKTQGQDRESAAGGPDGERRASSLDLSQAELHALSAMFDAMALDCLAPDRALPVFPDTNAARLREIFNRPLPAEGFDRGTLERGCREIVNHNRRNNHPRMFGYVASPAAPVGALASLLASALNSNVTSWRSAPAATEVERTVVRWLAEMVGYRDANEGCGGLLTSGGSMANLNALFVAHRAQEPREGNAEGASRRGLRGAGAPATLYASDQVHLSIPKAADVLGLGREQVRVVPSDEEFRMDVRALGRLVEADRRAGARPFCVVASAGTVATGAVDPLGEVARVAREQGLWFHVDGAYGALARAAAPKRALFEGLEEADSLSLDPHKWLYAPLDCGCLILREPERARAAFAGTEEGYIKVFEREEDEAFAFWDYGVELSRPFRALKIWAMLGYYGARRISDAIAEDCALAEHLGALVRAADDFELLAPVTLGICCFRYVPEGARSELERGAGEERERLNARLDDLNARVMHRVQRGGVAYLSNAILRGRFALRASITNFRTTRRDLAVTLDAVRRAALECLREEGREK
jgi:aromatic-L-amino-acid decarboxylase